MGDLKCHNVQMIHHSVFPFYQRSGHTPETQHHRTGGEGIPGARKPQREREWGADAEGVGTPGAPSPNGEHQQAQAPEDLSQNGYGGKKAKEASR